MASRSPEAPGARRLPAPVAVVAAAAAAALALPLVALIVRAPWSRLGAALSTGAVVESLWLSLLSASGATLTAALVGTPLAWALARGTFRGRGALRALVTVPMVLPPVVAGIALLEGLGRRGMLGGALEMAGMSLSFTTLGAVVAATFVSAPFLVLALESGFATVDSELEDAARTLGAGEWRVFRTVTAPALRPAYAAGGALCFARAVGEFGATITFAGNLRGRTQTAPLAIFETFQTDPGAAVALSLVLLALSFGLLLVLRARIAPS